MNLKPEYATLPLGALHAHEQFVEERVLEILAKLRNRGVVEHPIVVDRRTGVILDGHHRFEALKRLGSRLVPVALVDYADEAIRVESWHKSAPPPTKEDVVRHALAGKLYPPKTTRHPAFYGLPAHPVKLSELRAHA